MVAQPQNDVPDPGNAYLGAGDFVTGLTPDSQFHISTRR
jgi:hypothetical protein